MHISLGILTLFAAPSVASSILLKGGTIIAFNHETNSLEVIRNGSVLVTDDRIAGIFSSSSSDQIDSPEDTEVVDITDKILTPGFIDTHKHGWQTAYKTLASNTTLVEYGIRYGEFASAGLFSAEDVYLGQIAGIYEALNAGVTSILDHAHHTWSDETSEAGMQASVDSGARIFWCYAFHPLPSFPFAAQVANFRAIAANPAFQGSPASLGIAFDTFNPNGNATEIDTVASLVRELNVSVLTTHVLAGPYGGDNTPEALDALGILDLPIPIVFSHASFISPRSLTLLRATNQHISITVESEQHYGRT